MRALVMQESNACHPRCNWKAALFLESFGKALSQMSKAEEASIWLRHDACDLEPMQKVISNGRSGRANEPAIAGGDRSEPAVCVPSYGSAQGKRSGRCKS